MLRKETYHDVLVRDKKAYLKVLRSNIVMARYSKVLLELRQRCLVAVFVKEHGREKLDCKNVNSTKIKFLVETLEQVIERRAPGHCFFSVHNLSRYYSNTI